MKKSLTLKLIGGGLLLCIVNLLSLTSCENFLNGESVKEEIIDTIAYNNAKDISISLSCKEEMGIILPENTVSGKLGYNIELQFIPNTSNYAVKNPDSIFEAVSRKDNSVSRSDCVEFTSIEQSAADKKDGIYRAKVKVKNDTGDILIRPSSAACVLLPKITAITPENDSKGVDQDTKIKITFNKALNPESFGDFSMLEIYSAETSNLKEFFDTPYFSEDKKSMYITPKSSRLLLAPDGGKQFMDITVALELSDVTDCDGLKVSGKINHTYRINQNYGNQKKVKVLVRTVEGTGSFLSDGEKECTVGYSLGELQFTLNKADYYFKGLEAVSKNDAKVSRAEKVSFTKTDFDEERGIYKYKVTVTEEADDILIQPKCILLPKARASYPVSDNTTYQQDTSIKVYFNKKIKLSDFADENGFLKNIEIKSGDTNLLDTSGGKLPYYKAPYLEDEDKTLVIPIVKGNYIIKDNSTKEISVSVKLAGLKDAVEGENAAFTQTSYDFSFKINSTKDSTPPQFKVLRLARTEQDARNGTNLITMDEFTHYAAKANYAGDSTKVAENIQNHHVNKVWIYFEGEDADSGVAGLEIREQLIRKTTGEENQGSIYDKTTNAATNCLYNQTTDNAFSNCFEYKFKSIEDGVVKLEIILKDQAENSSVQNVDLVKDTSCPLEVYLYDPTKKFIDDVADPHNAPYSIELKPRTETAPAYVTDMDGIAYSDTFISSNNDFSNAVKITDFSYGYDKKNLTSLNLTNEIIEEESSKYRIKSTANFNVDPYKDVYTKITICDLSGNTVEYTDVIPKIIEVTSFRVYKKTEKFNGSDVDYVYWYASFDKTADKNVMLDGSRARTIIITTKDNFFNGRAYIYHDDWLDSPYKNSIIDLPEGTYKVSLFYYDTTGSKPDFCSYGCKFISVTKDQDGNWSSDFGQTTTIEDSDVPAENQWSIVADEPVINAGVRTINISFSQYFIPNPNAMYYVGYKQGNNAEQFSFIKELNNITLSIPTVVFPTSSNIIHNTYTFSIYAYNSQNDYKQSATKSLVLDFDNVPPKNSYNGEVKVYNCNAHSARIQTGVSYSTSQKVKLKNVKYVLSNNAGLSDSIDWENIPEILLNNNTSSFYITYDGYETVVEAYLYYRYEDKNGNYNTFSAPISLHPLHIYPEITWDSENQYFEESFSKIFSKGYITTREYINKDSWEPVTVTWKSYYYDNAYEKGMYTIGQNEQQSFIRIQGVGNEDPTSQASTGDYSYTLYFYAPYEIAKNTSSPIVCKLKDLYIGKAGINILADQPCFAHTMYCTRNLGDSPAAWLDGGFETGLVMEQKSFTYANSKAAGVPQGNYYTTVVHFADGTTLMTDVKQK